MEPHPSDAIQALGARLNPPTAELGEIRTLILAVKPQVWKAAAADIAPSLAPDAVIVSIAAGVTLADIAAAFGGRRVGRVMPTTAVAIGKGVASIYAPDPEAHARAHALFAPVGVTVDLIHESLMHAATAVSGSAPAYLYAFIEALEAAGAKAGLSEKASASPGAGHHRRGQRLAGGVGRRARRTAPSGDLARRHNPGGAGGADGQGRAWAPAGKGGGGGFSPFAGPGRIKP